MHFYQQSTLKNKLTFLFVSILITLGLVFFGISSFITQVTLQNQIDHHIHIVVLEAKRISETYTGDQRLELLRNLVSSQGMTIVLLNTDGSPILQTNSPDVATISEHQLLEIVLESSFSTVPQHFTVGDIRFATLPADLESGRGVLGVGYSTQIIQDTLQRLLIAFGGTLVVVLILSLFIVFRSLIKLLHPLDSISKLALSISSSTTLSQRISPLPKTRELHDIAVAFNTMLQRLETVFETEHSFFADAAHTLKTPLAVLRSQVETGKEAARKKQKMVETIDQASETIKQLLFISQVQTRLFRPEVISLSELVQQLAELAETLGTSKQLVITKNIEANVTISADKTLLAKALGNIVKNAVEHTPSKGKILLSLSLSQKGSVITITNTGSSISKQDRAQLFARFYKGANATTGSTGLGLAISKAVVDAHNGTISVRSRKHQTSFIVTLPR